MKFTLVIPTYNGGELFEECISSIKAQSLQPERILIIDSSSTDGTGALVKENGYDLVVIPQSEFDHGGTRSKALEMVYTPIVLFLTQDAILHDIESFKNLIACFENLNVGAAYGRQIPHFHANLLASHARKNSYKAQSYVTSINSCYPIGFRKAFISNSFAAYNLEHLKKVGFFPSRLILGEDSYVAAKMLNAGLEIAYTSDALVRHSHNYSYKEEFRRYFDIGVFHQSQIWMLESLGRVEGEGVKFAIDQLKFLLKGKKPWLVGKSVIHSFSKFFGYKLGRNHSKLNNRLCRQLSMHRNYWN